jgi:hypothetical protein
VVATGPAARRLATATLDGLRLGRLLRAVFSTDAFLVLGDAEQLPWADGAAYLGREDGLLLPTTEAPSVPADLLRCALTSTVPGPEYAVLPDRLYAFSAPAADPDPGWLAQYASGGA